MFVDKAKVSLKAGKGGDGANGANGGNGSGNNKPGKNGGKNGDLFIKINIELINITIIIIKIFLCFTYIK